MTSTGEARFAFIPTNRLSRIANPTDSVLAAVLLAPAAILLAIVIVYPIGRLIFTSFHDLSLTSGLPARFVGFENFVLLLDDPVFWKTLWNTALITVVTVPGALLVGLAFALMANLPFRVKWPIRLALLMPWALPLAFCGLIFAWFFHSEYGIANDILRRLGLPTVIWFNSPGWSMWAINVTIVWKSSSFMAMIIIAGLQVIPHELYEAAEMDGAGKVRQFFSITLPLLKPAIVVALIFRTITALQTFDIPYTMTRGGPGNATEPFAMYVYQTTVDFLDLGYGSALAVVMFLLSMVVSVFYLKMIRART